MQKRNDYVRYKALRKINRRRKADQEKQSKIAEKELKKRLRFTPRKFEDGLNPGYIRQNNDPIAFDPNTGELLDQITGERGTMIAPEIVVSGRDFRKERDFRYRLQHERPDGGMQFGDFIHYPDGRRVVSGQGLKLTYPEFDLLPFLKIPINVLRKATIPINFLRNPIRKPYTPPSIQTNALGDLLNTSKQAAETYANSKEREQLYNNFLQEARGEQFINNDFFPVRRLVKQNPSIRIERLPDNTGGTYRYDINTITLNSSRMDNNTLYHELLHNQMIGEAPSYLDDPVYKMLSDQVKSKGYNIGNLTQQELNDDYVILQKMKRIRNDYTNLKDFYIKKAKQAVSLEDSYIDTPYELSVIGNTTGRKLGIPAFSKYPGDAAMDDIIRRAIDAEPWMQEVKRSTPEEKQTFWKVLTGNYIPSLLGASMVGTKTYNNNKKK